MPEGYRHLSQKMLLYAKEALAKDGKFRALILDGNGPMRDIVARLGFIPTQDKERGTVYPTAGDAIHVKATPHKGASRFMVNSAHRAYGRRRIRYGLNPRKSGGSRVLS